MPAHMGRWQMKSKTDEFRKGFKDGFLLVPRDIRRSKLSMKDVGEGCGVVLFWLLFGLAVSVPLSFLLQTAGK